MAEQFHFSEDRLAFRAWLEENIKLIGNPMPEIEEEYKKSNGAWNPKLWGMLACYSFLMISFRWGSLMHVEESLKETQLVFPQEIEQPWIFLNGIYGVAEIPTGTAVSLANAIWDEETDTCVGMRFSLNSLPELREVEDNFRKLLVNVEASGFHLYKSIDRFLQNPTKENLELCRDTLGGIKETLKTDFTQEKIDPAIWVPYVRLFEQWGLDGKAGANGSQMMSMSIIDKFLGIEGKCPLFKLKEVGWQGMTSASRALIKTLDANIDTRFLKFQETYQEMKSTLVVIRSMHRSRALPYLKSSIYYTGHEFTAHAQEEDSMSKTFKEETNKRIMETQDKKNSPIERYQAKQKFQQKICVFVGILFISLFLSSLIP